MLQNAIVVNTNRDKGTATVSVMRKTACGECAGRYACGAAKKTLTEVNDPIGVNVGDAVELEVSSESVLMYAALVFLAPVVLALLLYYMLLFINSVVAVIGACCGFVIPFVIARIISSKKGVQARPIITRILPPAEKYAECGINDTDGSNGQNDNNI